MTNEILIVTNSISREITGLEVVKSVNDFYSSAFNQLLVLVSILAALVGVVLPILMQLYQKREMKVRETELKSEMASLLQKTEADLLACIGKKFDSESEKLSQSLKDNTLAIEKRFAKAEGYTFHIIANGQVEKGNHLGAAANYCRTALLYCKATNGADLVNILNSLTKAVLPKLTKEDLEKDGLKERLDEVLKEVGGLDHQGFLKTYLKEFSEAFRQVKARGKSPAT